MPIDEDLFSQNIGDLERDKFKATGSDNETAVRTDGKTSIQSADGTRDVDVSDRYAVAVYDNNARDCLEAILRQLKIMNQHLAEITGEESLINGNDT